MLARLDVFHGQLPTWVYLKLLIWLLISAGLALPYRGRAHARALIIALPVLTVLAAAVALYKPF
jgi:hypothetical protein